MIRSLMFLLALLCSEMLYAQSYRIQKQEIGFGIQAKAILSRMEIVSGLEDFKSEGYKAGMHFGAFIRLRSANFLFQPEVSYGTTCNTIYAEEFSGNEGVSIKFKMRSFQVPMLVGYGIDLGEEEYETIKVLVGPVFDFITKHELSLNTERTNASPVALATGAEEAFNEFGIGLRFGVGLDLNKLIIDAYYEHKLSKTFDTVLIDDAGAFENRHHQWVLSVGLLLWKAN
ncbi:porin family protein [Roseivirga pacifica]|uniref:porin family protein n=1 Tax=Roseivirga pacifica TaxID=1267423 RepID=UPI002095B84C|nr:porin family protein [Roseivirga pacifica]MCO6360367.1 outer membrane beta-barrel protein [Roseivirga pacifica]MCO6368256.1 outer membrane beta-barrel protein [Roseivirga pacifica]MCO6372398.1 outer membrane beta-barrel protein [Roseivirga pacifica]MCO6376456.1 outer membrane beta-barrel protein [Roseivirga pacifica]MCO6378264.1 outer membrane beta-barrel protein [Roseivirga pacifica]